MINRSEERSGGSQNNLPMDEVTLRLQQVEQAVEQLTNSINGGLEDRTSTNSNWSLSDVVRESVSTGSSSAQRNEPNPDLFIGPSSSFFFLKETSANLDKNTRSLDSPAHQSARSELQRLSTSLTTAVVDHEQDAPDAPAMSFFIPSRQVGYALISRNCFASRF